MKIGGSASAYRPALRMAAANPVNAEIKAIKNEIIDRMIDEKISFKRIEVNDNAISFQVESPETQRKLLAIITKLGGKHLPGMTKLPGFEVAEYKDCIVGVYCPAAGMNSQKMLPPKKP